jgi:hypothetical protein
MANELLDVFVSTPEQANLKAGGKLMAESVYNRRESIALAGLALSLPTISSAFGETSPSYRSTTTPGGTHWNGSELSGVSITSEKPIPITEMGLPIFDRPISRSGEIRLLGRRQPGRGYDLA